MKTQANKNDIEETGKDGNKMDTDESGGEESWKDEDVGAEEDEAEDVSDQDSPTHSAILGNVNSQPMVEKDDKVNEEKEMNFEREKNKETEKETAKDSLSKEKEGVGEGLFLDNLKNLTKARLGFDKWTYEFLKNMEKNGKKMEEKRKEDDRNHKQWKQDMEEKAKKMEAQIDNLEEGKAAMKNLLGMFLNILTAVTKNLEEISKVLESSSSPKLVVDLYIDEDAIKTGIGDSTPGGAAKRTRWIVGLEVIDAGPIEAYDRWFIEHRLVPLTDLDAPVLRMSLRHRQEEAEMEEVEGDEDEKMNEVEEIDSGEEDGDIESNDKDGETESDNEDGTEDQEAISMDQMDDIQDPLDEPMQDITIGAHSR
ncbi:uncharacterized protein LOC131856869 [Cryptomeria japonica]|uniref:uncharacterized protein LOC131856869 n=1 Tax=Cryptomeria japonica TaxID=3369 RepID=UPI0027DA5A27|nr:uncharacterized protein LOC131856869 [Cryptomeria japonica]